MFTQKITNFKTKPYSIYDEYDNLNLICPDAKYDSHHAELFNPTTGEVYLEDVNFDGDSINRFTVNPLGYYDLSSNDEVYYGDYIPQW